MSERQTVREERDIHMEEDKKIRWFTFGTLYVVIDLWLKGDCIYCACLLNGGGVYFSAHPQGRSAQNQWQTLVFEAELEWSEFACVHSALISYEYSLIGKNFDEH